MFRGRGIDVLHDVFPESSWIAFGLVTQLGDTWFIAVLLTALYWFYDRDALTVPIAYAISGLSILIGVKYELAVPRPDRPIAALETVPTTLHPLYDATATASGFGFPSGHALMATVVYLSLARFLPERPTRRGVLSAAGIIGIVSLSRVVLGVHFVVDVISGILVGLFFLVVANRAIQFHETDPTTIAFSIALGLSLLTRVGIGSIRETNLLLGAALGAFGAWQLVTIRITAPSDRFVPDLLGEARYRWLGVAVSLVGLLALSRPGQLVWLGAVVVIFVPWVGPPVRELLPTRFTEQSR